MKHTPLRAESAIVMLANNAGSFTVRGCPDAIELASNIQRAMNCHETLVAALKEARFALVDVESEYRPVYTIADTITAAFASIDSALAAAEAQP